jgi:hypothetical protein
VIASLIAGCRLPWGDQPEAPIRATDDLQQAEVTAPVGETRPNLPPALVEVSPIPATVLAVQQPITLYFNQAMNASSVEAAIHFEPRISGRFTWQDDQMLTFLPDQNLAPGSHLRLTIATSAQAANLQNLSAPVDLNFQVADFLRVVQTLPADGVQDVNPESVVFVAFNQPVAALGEPSDPEPGFSLSPEVPGKGEWLNTSTYVFTPETGLLGGTSYTIQLNPDLVATSGAGLAPSQPLEFDFTTTHPMVVRVRPIPGNLLSLDGPVEIDFNMRMNPDSVEAHFSLVGPGGMAVPGTFEWDDHFRQVKFKPARLLARNANYSIRLSGAAESAGGLPIYEALDTVRQTYPRFAVDLSVPPQFDSYYGGYGQYSLEFSTPLNPEVIDEHISIDPEVTGVRFTSREDEGVLWVNGYFQPETTYTLNIDPAVADIWGGQLGETFTATFLTPPAPPSLSVLSGYVSYNLVFVPAFDAALTLQATNISTVHVELAPIGTGDLVTLLHPDNYRYREIFLPEVREVTTHNLNLNSNRREVIRLPLSYQGEPLVPGVYFLGLDVADIPNNEPESYQKYYLVVSENNLVMKITPEQAFLWGTRLGDLSPLADAPVAVYDTEGDLLTRGSLDADGRFMDQFARVEQGYASYYAWVGEPGEEDFAFTISTWQQGYDLYEHGIDVNTYPALLDAYIYTDRPIYRPGDTVYFKTVLFSRDNGLPVSPAVDAVTVAVQGDPGLTGRPATLYSQKLALNPYGMASGSVILPDDAPTGYYWVDVSVGDEFIKSVYFDVAAYRKPEIDLQVGFEQAELLAGEELVAAAQAEYFFGLPAADQAFSWSLYRKDAHFDLPGYSVGPLDDMWVMRPFFPRFSPLGESVASGSGMTGEGGDLRLPFTADDLRLDEFRAGQLQEYSLEVTVMDESGLPVSYRDAALVHPERFYIGVQPGAYFGRAGTAFDFSALTVDWEKTPVGNVPLEATFEAISWEAEGTSNPERPYQYVETTTMIGGASPITDRKGQARLSFTPPEPGTYRLTVESGAAVTQVLVWVSGESAAIWPTQMYNHIDLTADAGEYLPGETAQVFIPNPFPSGANALVTVERWGVLDSQILEISDSGAVLAIPIAQDSIPNVYVSAVLVGSDERGRPDYRQGTIKLLVSPTSKALNIDLSLEPDLAEPGDLVTLNLRITDQQGNPIQGEFSIVVVDKALLALVPPNSLPIFDAIYEEIPLSVQTSLSLYTYAQQQALTPIEAGGLGGGADRIVDAAIREDFPDTAFWEAHVITGVDGTARLTLPLPDTLTTWVVEARGLTEDYLVGQAEAEIQTQKPLMIRPVTPRFLVDGDEVEMAAVVHNNTDAPLEVEVSLVSAGFSLMEANHTQQVNLDPGQSQRVTWWGSVDSVESVSLVFEAHSGALSDASTPVWGDLQVRRYAMPYTFSTAGQLSEAGERLELVSLPISTEPSSGELSMDLNPSLLTTLVDGLEALETAPYSDTATVLSRMLANLNAYLVLDNLDVDTPQMAASLSELIGEGIGQLLSGQNIDGGWSWWGGSINGSQASDPFITAYVLLGLTAADEAGMEIGEDFIVRARNYLVFELPQPGEVESAWMLDRTVFMAYALRGDDGSLAPTFDGLYARRTELSPWALGLLALAMHDTAGMNARVTTLVSDLEGRAIRSATGVHWENARFSWMLPGTPVYNTAVAVYALAQLDPASASLPLALRYLMAHQGADKLWSTGFESAWVLMAVAKAAQGTGDYQADFEFQATLNGVLIAEGLAAGPELLNTVSASTAIDSLVPDGPNALVIHRGEGAGTLYYRVDLNTYQPAADAEPIQRGITLNRAYYFSGEECPADEACPPIDSIKLDPDDPGQFITVVLTVNLAQDMYHLLVEDFIPAGTEILNRGLLTSQTLPQADFGWFDPCDPFANGWGWWLFNAPQIYDDHILWTAGYVPAGTYLLTYELLPYQRGAYQVLPAHTWQYFYPEVQGTTAGDVFLIE